MKKKGYAMLLDSIAALTFILMIGILIVHLYQPKMSQTSIVAYKNMHYISEDILDVLNKKGVLDDIGTEWAVSNGSTNSTHFENATNITKEYFDSLIPSNLGYRVLIDDTVIYDSDADNSSNRIGESDSTTKTHASRLLVGYAAGLPTVGNVARSFLTNIREKETSSYAYFGGFVGQGNLTRVLALPFNMYVVKQICMEYSSGESFDLYIDESSAIPFPTSGAGMSSKWQCVSNPETFISEGGTKTFQIKFDGDSINDHYLGGGYLKVTYNTSLQETSPESDIGNYFFPGIDGLINLYSSFYVPGTLDEMNISLYLRTNYSTYLNIGDVRVFNFTGDNTNQTFILNDSYIKPILIAGGLSYMDLSENTIPIKISTEGVGSGMIGNILNVSGNITKSFLYPESYIRFRFTPSESNLSEYGDITLEQDTEIFNEAEDCTGNLFVTGNAVVTEAKITSYSAEHWTHELYVGGSREYYLGDYGSNYTRLGDPYAVNIPEPVTNLQAGNNTIIIKTGNAPGNDTGCSANNSAIYTIRLNSGVGYGDVFTERDGCIWNIQFEDDSEMSVSVPGNYTGTGECSYREGNVTDNSQDAIDDAIYRLLVSLDSNDNDKMDIKFDSNMLEFSFTRSGGVRSLWGPADFKLVMWM